MPILRNARHERFAQALAHGKSASEAYVSAGYQANTGNATTLKHKESISTRVAELLATRQQVNEKATELAVERIALTKEWVLSRLVQNADRAMQAEAVKDAEGRETGEYRYEGSVANRALELIGKELGMFIDRKEVGQPGEFEALDDTALMEKLCEEAKALGFDLNRGATQH